MKGASTPLGGYVAGYPGGTVTNFTIDGFPGQPDTSGLPPGTSNGLFTQIPSGKDVVIRITTSSPPTGPFTVAPINQAQTGYGPSFACPISAAEPEGGSITVALSDVDGDGMPEVIVTTPRSGSIITQQAGGPRTPLVKPERRVVKMAREITIPLLLTAAGKAQLEQDGTYTVRVKITFRGTDGHKSIRFVRATFAKP